MTAQKSRRTDFKINFDSLQSQVKESILNIFTFPSLTYVVQNDIVITFNLANNLYFPSYIGIMKPDEQMVLPATTWDWCRGTLVGKLNGQMVYIWNTQTELFQHLLAILCCNNGTFC